MCTNEAVLVLAPHASALLSHTLRVNSNTASGRELQRFLKVPVDGYDDVLTILKLENYLGLYGCFDYEGRKSLSQYLLQTVLDKEAHISSLEQVSETDTVGESVHDPEHV